MGGMPKLADVPIVRSELPYGDASVDKTVETMAKCAMGKYGARSPKIRALAIDIVNRAGVVNKDYKGMAIACYRWVRDNIRYVKDPIGQEAVCNPEYLLEVGGGDCDDLSTLVAALCGSLGIQTRFKVIAVGSRQFGHVYLEAEGQPGEWISLDPIMREHDAGWEAPSPTRKKVYPINGPEGLSGLRGLGDLAMDGSLFDQPVGSNINRPYVGQPEQIRSFLRKPIGRDVESPRYFVSDAADGGQSARDPGLRREFGIEGLVGMARPAMPMEDQGPITQSVMPLGNAGNSGSDEVFGGKVRVVQAEVVRHLGAGDRLRGVNPLTIPSMAVRPAMRPDDVAGLGQYDTSALNKALSSVKRTGLNGILPESPALRLGLAVGAVAAIYLLFKKK